jgi:UDP-2,4-diacetamido-2,4,6-trideoxy-beta-L-altropyranose hydrolase
VRIIIRVDASTEIGTGHVMRCLTLAERLRKQDGEVNFVCRELDGHLCDLIAARSFFVHRLPAPPSDWRHSEDEPRHAAWLGLPWQEDLAQTFAAIARLPLSDWMVVDHYALDRRWEDACRTRGIKLLAIDDLADRSHSCDILLDHNLVARQAERYSGKIPETCTALLGSAYALLHEDYALLRPRARQREGPIGRVLVSFGGVDNDRLTETTVNALIALNLPHLEADIVISAGSPQFQPVAERVADRPNLRLHDRVPSLAPLMLAADLAIGASGITNWERLCLGLPALVVTTAENQRPIAAELSRRGVVQWLGDADEVDQAQMERILDGLFTTGLDAAWSQRCLRVVDGLGADRVSAVLLAHPGMALSVRDAALQDESLLLDWANDPLTRKNAFDPKPINPKEHRAWFRARLGDRNNCALYVLAAKTGVPVGQVRFDRRDDWWEVSYSLAPPFRGRRIGLTMLETAIDFFRQDHTNIALFGQVKPENLASIKIFEALAFELKNGSSEDRHIYERVYSE